MAIVICRTCSLRKVGFEKYKITRKVRGVLENIMVLFMRAMAAPHS